MHWINDEGIQTAARWIGAFIVSFALLLFLRQADPSGIAAALVADLLFIGGLWTVLSPADALAAIHPQIGPSDSRLWWMPRFFGVGLMALSILVVLAAFR